VDDNALRQPPCCNDPCTRTLLDGRFVKRCSECSGWEDHLRDGHSAVPAEKGNNGKEQGNVAVNANNVQAGAAVGDLAENLEIEEAVDNTIGGDTAGDFVRLRAAGMLCVII